MLHDEAADILKDPIVFFSKHSPGKPVPLLFATTPGPSEADCICRSIDDLADAADDRIVAPRQPITLATPGLFLHRNLA
jgi:hypothetical protein